jgi:CubicO group peptidase (beta-lactamase class C family)
MDTGHNPDKRWGSIAPEASGIAGIVIARDGRLAYEKYYNGCGAGDRHHLSSVTKSVVSALIGIAIDAGFIQGVSQRVLDFFPDMAGTGELAGEATIRHLLTMTAPYGFEDWREPFTELCASADWERYILGSLGRGGPLGRFKYSSMGAHLLSCIITRATGKSAREFANERLFGPIGISELPDFAMEGYGYEELFGNGVRGWVKDPAGNSAGGWGLALTPREMARFGALYVERGAWEGRRVISEAWIDESTALSSEAELGGSRLRYGYLWWLSGEGEEAAYMAQGDGGNIICCLPERRAVVAIASSFSPEARDRWAFIKEWILPAISD